MCVFDGRELQDWLQMQWKAFNLSHFVRMLLQSLLLSRILGEKWYKKNICQALKDIIGYLNVKRGSLMKKTYNAEKNKLGKTYKGKDTFFLFFFNSNDLKVSISKYKKIWGTKSERDEKTQKQNRIYVPVQF